MKKKIFKVFFCIILIIIIVLALKPKIYISFDDKIKDISVNYLKKNNIIDDITVMQRKTYESGLIVEFKLKSGKILRIYFNQDLTVKKHEILKRISLFYKDNT